MKRDDKKLKKNTKECMPHVLLLLVASFSLLFLMAGDGRAAESASDYPSKPIEYVTHAAPGSNVDLYTRAFADSINAEKLLSKPLVVVNKQGSGGAKASAYLFERKGNAYIIQTVTTNSYLTTPLLNDVPWTYDMFTPINNNSTGGNILCVKGDSPFKTVDDIIAEAKKRPNQLIQGGGSFSSAGGMSGQVLQKLKGVQWNYISFGGYEPEAMLNILSGNVHFAFLPPGLVLDYVKTGKLRALVSATPARFPGYENVPTMEEANMGDPIMQNRGVVGPPGMPDYAVKKITAAFKKVLDSDRMKKYLTDAVEMAWYLPPDEYKKLLKKSSDQWKVVLGDAELLKKFKAGN
jgi:putative tricarboxylic transport membrane protein